MDTIVDFAFGAGGLIVLALVVAAAAMAYYQFKRLSQTS